jgi:hypothetical protein
LSLHTPPPQPLKQQSFIGDFWSGSPSALQHGRRVEEYDPTSPIVRNAYSPRAPHEQLNPTQNGVPYNPTYHYYGTPQYPQYPIPSASSYWPYDAPQIPYNGFNFFSPSYPPQTYWQPQPPPIPSASGTIRIDNLPPSQTPAPQLPQIPHIPEPSQDYILTASLPPYRLESPNKKLLILDLNGTLLYRPKILEKDRYVDMRTSSQKPILRPHLTEFVTYIFRHYKIMFWSSATPRNVHAMIAAVTTPAQRAQLVGIWARDTLGLSEKDYNQKVITFKDLRKVFEDGKLVTGGKKGEKWDVSNVILLDDSVVKASYQPYNHVCVPEFVEKDGSSTGDDALWQAAGYLEEMRYQGHTARFVRQNPFRLGDGWNGMCMGLA